MGHETSLPIQFTPARLHLASQLKFFVVDTHVPHLSFQCKSHWDNTCRISNIIAREPRRSCDCGASQIRTRLATFLCSFFALGRKLFPSERAATRGRESPPPSPLPSQLPPLPPSSKGQGCPPCIVLGAPGPMGSTHGSVVVMPASCWLIWLALQPTWVAPWLRS